MEKVYLVLRNNRQNGPFTIGELLQQQLEPSDMIWIEGKSTAWTYLSELELAPLSQTSLTKEEEAESTSADEIEKKAEELRRKLLSAAPKTYIPQHAVQIESYASPYKFSEEEIQFVDHRKERKLRRNAAIGETVLTCFVIGLFFMGIYKGKSFLGVEKRTPNSVATHLNSSDAHTAEKTRLETQQTFLIPDSTRTSDSSIVAALPKAKFATVKKNLPDSLSIKTAEITINTITEPAEEKENEKKEENKTENATITVPEEIPAKKVIHPVIKESPVNDAKTAEEKKGFLKGIFRKKKKEDPPSDKKEEKKQ